MVSQKWYRKADIVSRLRGKAGDLRQSAFVVGSCLCFLLLLVLLLLFLLPLLQSAFCLSLQCRSMFCRDAD